MCQWTVEPYGELIEISKVSLMNIAELNSKVEEDKHRTCLWILHERIDISQAPTGTGAPSKKEIVEPYDDDEESSKPRPKLEVTVDNSKEVN